MREWAFIFAATFDVLCIAGSLLTLLWCVWVAVTWAVRQVMAWRERQAKTKRDLKVALRTVEELQLENALLNAAVNMRKTLINIRPRSRGLHVVHK